MGLAQIVGGTARHAIASPLAVRTASDIDHMVLVVSASRRSRSRGLASWRAMLDIGITDSTPGSCTRGSRTTP